MATSPLPVDAYIRVSRVGDRSGESYISPEVQRKAITECAKRLGLVLRENPPEQNESGGTMDRPVFQQIMERIRTGESGGIIVWKLDRFARTLIGGYSYLTEIAQAGAAFASATEAEFDFTTPSGRMVLQMHLMMAEYFRALTVESWSTATRSAVERGVHPAPYGAYGYDRVNGHYVLNDEAPFIAEAFRLRVEERWTFGRIADWLNRDAPPRVITSRQGVERQPPWTGPAVKRLLSRRIYLGEAFYGTNDTPTRKASSKAARVVLAGAHDPIVDEALFLAAQQPVHAYSKVRKGDAALLQGVVRCAGCRYVMSPGLSGGVRVYRCRGHHVSGDCPAPAAVKQERLDTYVEQEFREALEARAAVYDASPESEAITRLEADLAGVRKSIAEMQHDTSAKERLGSRWLEFLTPYLDRETELKAALAEARHALAVTSSGLTVDAYRSLDVEERRKVLSSHFPAVMVRRGHDGGGSRRPPLGLHRVALLDRLPDDFPVKSRFAGGVCSWPWPEGEAVAGMLAT